MVLVVITSGHAFSKLSVEPIDLGMHKLNIEVI